MKFLSKIVDIYIEGNVMRNAKCGMRNTIKKGTGTFSLRFLAIFILVLLLGTAAYAAVGGPVADPISIGVGARAIGLGRAYVGMAEDGEAIFTNPAGLAFNETPRISSMHASLLGDVNYYMVGGAYPYGDRASIGAGIVTGGVSDIVLTDANAATVGSGNWSNSCMFLSYGTYVEELPVLGKIFKNEAITKDVMAGVNLKYYTIGGSGTSEVADASGTALDMDLGLLIPVSNSVTLGICGQNLLGGRIQKKSGVADYVPRVVKLGTKIKVMGDPENSLFEGTRTLYLNMDYDLVEKDAGASHVGLEFWPSENFALRAGNDNNNLTLGAGLKVSGLQFDYAYHTYDQINDNATHFFSIGYLGEGKKRALHVQLDSPADRAVIYDDFVKVAGKVVIDEGEFDKSAVVTLKVNDMEVPLAAGNVFEIDIPVDKVGKKMIEIQASDASGLIAEKDVRLVRLTSFADVPEGFWAKAPIENNATVGLVQGYPDGTFRPDRTLTRAELATLLVRAKGLPLPGRDARQIFADVKPDFWGAKYIEVAYENGLIEGYPDKTFRANNQITKAEGVTVLARFDKLPLKAVASKPFSDVETNFWAAKYIQAAKDSGMLAYVNSTRLEPAANLARAESIEMLAQTKLAGGMIKELYNWDSGFRREMIRTPKIRAYYHDPSIIAAIDQYYSTHADNNQ